MAAVAMAETMVVVTIQALGAGAGGIGVVMPEVHNLGVQLQRKVLVMLRGKEGQERTEAIVRLAVVVAVAEGLRAQTEQSVIHAKGLRGPVAVAEGHRLWHRRLPRLVPQRASIQATVTLQSLNFLQTLWLRHIFRRRTNITSTE